MDKNSDILLQPVSEKGPAHVHLIFLLFFFLLTRHIRSEAECSDDYSLANFG